MYRNKRNVEEMKSYIIRSGEKTISFRVSSTAELENIMKRKFARD
jgi:hypothetical protein